MSDTEKHYGLFPPKDFIPTAVVFGFWVSGVLAGVNLNRLGLTQRGKRMIMASIALPLIITVCGVLGTAVLGKESEIWYRQSPLSWGIALIFNGLIGYVLYRSQRDLYVQWTGTHQPEEFRDPYISPVVRVLIVMAVASLYFVIGLVAYILVR